MIPAWRSSVPAHDPQPSWNPTPGSSSACTREDCTHITPGADDPSQPLPTFIWPTSGCYAAWLRQRDLAARDGRPELVDEHDPACNQHGPRTGADRVAEVGWLRHNAPAEPQYTRRGDRAS